MEIGCRASCATANQMLKDFHWWHHHRFLGSFQHLLPMVPKDTMTDSIHIWMQWYGIFSNSSSEEEYVS